MRTKGQDRERNEQAPHLPQVMTNTKKAARQSARRIIWPFTPPL